MKPLAPTAGMFPLPATLQSTAQALSPQEAHLTLLSVLIAPYACFIHHAVL